LTVVRVPPDHDFRMKILALPGSLRDGSYNRLLIHGAEELAPDGVDIDTNWKTGRHASLKLAQETNAKQERHAEAGSRRR